MGRRQRRSGGEISPLNSPGSSDSTESWLHVVPLNNGNYVVSTPFWITTQQQTWRVTGEMELWSREKFPFSPVGSSMHDHIVIQILDWYE
jgi:hypothetical protein